MALGQIILISIPVSFLTQVAEHEQLVIGGAEWNCIVHRLVV